MRMQRNTWLFYFKIFELQRLLLVKPVFPVAFSIVFNYYPAKDNGHGDFIPVLSVLVDMIAIAGFWTRFADYIFRFINY